MSGIRNVVDVAGAPALGGAGLLAQTADLAGQATPILTAISITLMIAWYVWRMVDRVRFGPARLRGAGDED